MDDPRANIKLAGGATESTMHPAVLVLLILGIALIFFLPRKYIVLPILLLTFLTPFGEQIYVTGAHFLLGRVLIICGWLRIVRLKKPFRLDSPSRKFNSVDKAFLALAALSAVATLLQYMQMQIVVNQCGVLLDSMGGYFLLRFLIQDEEDILRVIKTLAVIACTLAATMVIERTAGQNVFGFIGGRLAPFVRDGVIRSQATFEGPIPAGTFAAPLLCLFPWLWLSGKAKFLSVAGTIGGTIMVLTSASSTPLLGFLGAMVGLSMWPFRKRMRAVRWGIVFSLIGCQLVMKAPVWFLINHVDLVAGNSGYHRAMLIDACVRHFWDWWLIGVKSTYDWGWDMWDQANQFVAVADGSGLAPLIVFIALISWSFGRIGTARKLVTGDRKSEPLLWLLGAALFSHVVAFFGLSYNDQTTTSWYALLAMISAATAPIMAGRIAAQPQADIQSDDTWFLSGYPSEASWATFGRLQLDPTQASLTVPEEKHCG